MALIGSPTSRGSADKMVFESIRIHWLAHHPLLSYFIGFGYTFLGYGVAWFFFRADPSVPMLFLTTLLLVPSLIKLLSLEERVERRVGLRHFFRNHRRIIEIYLFLFLGIFTAYLLLGSLNLQIFQYQLQVLERQQGLSAQVITSFLDTTFQPTMAQFLSVLEMNLFVVLLLFVLSFFYGAGAVFLITLNASVFASFVWYTLGAVAKLAASPLVVIGIFSIHMLPEVAGFLIAAIAGGVVSSALIREKLFSTEFRNVCRDAFVLLFIAALLIVIGAALEVFVTTRIFAGTF